MVTFENCDTQRAPAESRDLRTPPTDRGSIRAEQLHSVVAAAEEARSNQLLKASAQIDVRVQDALDPKRFGKIVTVIIPPGEKFEVNYHRVTEKGTPDNQQFPKMNEKEYEYSKSAAGELWREQQSDGSTKVIVATYVKHDQLEKVGHCQRTRHNEEFRGYLTVTTGDGKQTVHVNIGNGQTNDHLKRATPKSLVKADGVTSPSVVTERVDPVKPFSGRASEKKPMESDGPVLEKKDNIGPGVTLPEKNSSFSEKTPALFQMDDNGVLTVYHGQLLNSFRVGEALRKGTVAGIVPPTTKNELEVHERIVQQAGPFRGMEVRRDNRPGAPANQFLIWPTGEGASGSYVLSAARIGNETNRVAFTILHSNAGLSNTEVPKQKGAGREILPDLTPSRDSKREPDSTSLAQGSPANQLKQMERVDAQSSPSDRIVRPGPIEVELGKCETLCLHYKTFAADGTERARSFSGHAIRPDTASTTIPGVGKITRIKGPSGRDIVRIEPMEGFSGEISTRPATVKEATIHPFHNYHRGEATASSHRASKER